MKNRRTHFPLVLETTDSHFFNLELPNILKLRSSEFLILDPSL